MGVRKKPCDMGKVPFDEELWEAQRWCIRNDIAIAPKSKNDTAWYITIKNKDKVNTSPDTYGKTEIWTKIFEYAKYYYDKHRK
tara:strand:- start:3500 stop:3748 length:249 start_codon:yes stop_codon:yes gene_type:complete